MCGRYRLTAKERFLSELFNLDPEERAKDAVRPSCGGYGCSILTPHGQLTPPAQLGESQRLREQSRDFIRAHMVVMVGTDFFTAEVLTLKGLKTFYVLLFIHLESRRICLAGITRHPDQEWMEQMAQCHDE